MKPLDGIRVLEQGTFITGPCAGMLLADLGADVIKVEAPGVGDPYRNFEGGLFSAHFQAYNRNKRSIALDLKARDDQDVFNALVESADVYIQNFRPGTVARLGVDYDRLLAINSRLIYCSISGFGQSGPYVDRPTYDTIAQALSGFLSVSSERERPRILGPALADAMTGIYAAMGILSALVRRGQTGAGQHIEISMLETMMHFATEPYYGYFALNAVPTALDRPRLAQAFLIVCKDKKVVALHLSSLDKFWDALIAGIDGAHLARDPRFAIRQSRIENYLALVDALNQHFSARRREEWVERLSRFDVPFAPVLDVDEAVNDEQVRHLGVVVPVTSPADGATHAVRSPFSFDGIRDTTVNGAPHLNEHGAAIREAIAARSADWPPPNIGAVVV